jgi:hypothetical protein
MLEIRQAAVAFDKKDLMELERIIIDDDGNQALQFLKKSIYDRILHSQQGRLKSHLENISTVEGFIQGKK